MTWQTSTRDPFVTYAIRGNMALANPTNSFICSYLFLATASNRSWIFLSVHTASLNSTSCINCEQNIFQKSINKSTSQLIPKRLGATRILPNACQVQAPVTLTERLGDSRKHNHLTGIRYSSKGFQLGICFGGETHEETVRLTGWTVEAYFKALSGLLRLARHNTRVATRRQAAYDPRTTITTETGFSLAAYGRNVRSFMLYLVAKTATSSSKYSNYTPFQILN